MKKKILRVVEVLLLLVILFCLFQIGSYLWGRWQSDRTFDVVAQEVESVASKQEGTRVTIEGKKEKVPEVPDYRQLLSTLQAKNADTIAYLIIDGTQNKYPIMYSGDNSFYLRKGIDKKYNIQGIPFMDYQNKKDLSDQNTVLYGHMMYATDTIFGIVKRFFEQNFTDQSQKTFTLVTQSGVYHYRMFSVRRLDADAKYRVPNMEASAFVNYLENARKHSATDFAFSRPFTERDHIVTLSTCTPDQDETQRLALLGVLESVDTIQANAK